MESNVRANSIDAFVSDLVFCDIRPIRNHQLIRLTPKDEQVNVSHEVRIMFEYFVTPNLFGVVAAAIRVMLIAKITFLIGLSCLLLC